MVEFKPECFGFDSWRTFWFLRVMRGLIEKGLLVSFLARVDYMLSCWYIYRNICVNIFCTLVG